MTRSTTITTLIILAVLLIIGCSGNSNPVAPDTFGENSPSNLTSQSDPADNPVGGHELWGFWQGDYNLETGEFEFIPLRDVQFHLNATGPLNSAIPGLSININTFTPPSGNIDFDLTIQHPFPGTNFRGFDTWGIVMGAGDTQTSSLDPGAVFPSPRGMRILNADGLTRWWNAQEFMSPGFYGFTPGKLGPNGFKAQTTINQYKYFADILQPTDPVSPTVNTVNRGTFSTDGSPPTVTRNYQIQFPIGPNGPIFAFQYAIASNWSFPTGSSPPPKPVVDFPMEANCPEAYNIQVRTAGTTAWYINENDLGGNINLQIEVFDWGAPTNPGGIDTEIASIWVESPTLFPTAINIPKVSTPGSQPTSGIYMTQIQNVTPAGLENQEILVTVRSSDPTTYAPPINGPSYPAGASLAAYALVEIPISNIKPTEDTITVESPNGGETWEEGSLATINWSWSGSIPTVNIDLSLDHGATFPISIATGEPNDGDFEISNVLAAWVSNDARIRVSDSLQPTIFDVSDDDFSIVPLGEKTLFIKNPDGGEQWQAGGNEKVDWDSTGDIPLVDIALSLDSGATFPIDIATGEANTGTFDVSPLLDWVTDTARIKVSDSADSLVFDESDEDFSIKEDVEKTITVIKPNGGEIWVKGGTAPVQWSSTGTIPEVNIDLSLNAGLSYDIILGTNIPNTGNFNVMPVGQWDSMNAMVRISDSTDPFISDESDNVFSIVEQQQVEVTIPNGGEVWNIGEPQQVTWTWQGVFPTVNIDLSLDEGDNWPINIATDAPNIGFFDIDSMPGPDSDKAMIRVMNSDNPSVFDTSDDVFTLVAEVPPSITVEAPNGGEIFTGGSTTDILWSSINVFGQVKIEYRFADVDPWIELTAGTDNDGVFKWNSIPNAGTSEAKVQVTSVDNPLVFDESDGHFTITAVANTINLIAPNGGEHMDSGGQFTIEWGFTGTITSVNIDLSTDGGINFDDPVATGVPSTDFSYNWDPIPLLETYNGIIRIADANDPGTFDMSDNPFEIVPPVIDTVTLTSPDGGELMDGGGDWEITWTFTGSITTVEFDLSTDGGSTWPDTIMTDVPVDDLSAIWDPIPSINTTDAMVRIRDTFNAGTFDESNGTFEIQSTNPTGWNPKVDQTQLIPADPVPNQLGVEPDIAVYNGGFDDQSVGEIVDQTDDTFYKYNDDYSDTSGITWQYGIADVGPFHKFDVLPDGSRLFLTLAGTDPWNPPNVNDPTHSVFSTHDNTTGTGSYVLFGDGGVPDPDALPFRQAVDWSCGVPGGISDDEGYQLNIFSPENDVFTHDGNILLAHWIPPYTNVEMTGMLVDASTQGGGTGDVDDTNPDIMALAVDDATDLVIGTGVDEVPAFWILDSAGEIQCILADWVELAVVVYDNKIDSEEFGTAVPVDLTIGNSLDFDYQVTAGGFNWVCVLLDNGDGTWSVGVWEADFLTDPGEITEIGISPPVTGIPLSIDFEPNDFEIHVLSDNGGTIEVTVLDYTP
ncbi:MAG TPA: hypothetical protein VGB30_14990 [bacterium]|jgi:hypothetical protein